VPTLSAARNAHRSRRKQLAFDNREDRRVERLTKRRAAAKLSHRNPSHSFTG
jgi:hypothetical protein